MIEVVRGGVRGARQACPFLLLRSSFFHCCSTEALETWVHRHVSIKARSGPACWLPCADVRVYTRSSMGLKRVRGSLETIGSSPRSITAGPGPSRRTQLVWIFVLWSTLKGPGRENTCPTPCGANDSGRLETALSIKVSPSQTLLGEWAGVRRLRCALRYP